MVCWVALHLLCLLRLILAGNRLALHLARRGSNVWLRRALAGVLSLAHVLVGLTFLAYPLWLAVVVPPLLPLWFGPDSWRVRLI